MRKLLLAVTGLAMACADHVMDVGGEKIRIDSADDAGAAPYPDCEDGEDPTDEHCRMPKRPAPSTPKPSHIGKDGPKKAEASDAGVTAPIAEPMDAGAPPVIAPGSTEPPATSPESGNESVPPAASNPMPDTPREPPSRPAEPPPGSSRGRRPGPDPRGPPSPRGSHDGPSEGPNEESDDDDNDDESRPSRPGRGGNLRPPPEDARPRPPAR